VLLTADAMMAEFKIESFRKVSLSSTEDQETLESIYESKEDEENK